MQLERQKTEKVFERLSPEQKWEFIKKGTISGLIKTQEDADFWKSKIPPEEIFDFNWELGEFYRKTGIEQVELNQEQAKIRINTMLLVADWVEKNFPKEAEQLRERAKADAKYFGLNLEEI